MRLLSALLLLLASSLACAASPLRVGDIVIHYSVVPTTLLQPEVAQRSGITRASSRALLNIAVQRDTGGPLPEAVGARVRGTATALTGQQQTLTPREVREGDAIYYLAEVLVHDGETLRFELEIVPLGRTEAIPLRFEQQFFRD